MHRVAFALVDPKPTNPKLLNAWIHANKVCRHTILSTLSDNLFDVYGSYKEAKAIWESMKLKYTTEDVSKQRFTISNYYRWEMTDDKDIKVQINEYHKLLEELKVEDITVQDQLKAGFLIEKLPES